MLKLDVIKDNKSEKSQKIIIESGFNCTLQTFSHVFEVCRKIFKMALFSLLHKFDFSYLFSF